MARGRVLWQNLVDRNLIPWVLALNNHISHHCKSYIACIWIMTELVCMILRVCIVFVLQTPVLCVLNQNSHLIIPRCDALALFALLLERVSFQES